MPRIVQFRVVFVLLDVIAFWIDDLYRAHALQQSKNTHIDIIKGLSNEYSCSNADVKVNLSK